MPRTSIFFVTTLCGILFAGHALHAQTAPSAMTKDSATTKQKHKEEIAREKREAAEQWSVNSQKALETWAATRQRRQECQKLASEKKLYFTKRSRFIRECMAGKAQ